MKWSLLYFFLGVIAALLLNEHNHLCLFPAALAGLALIDRRAFRIFLRWKLWLFFLLLVAIPVLVVGPRDARWINLPYNSTMLRLNLLMVERSILLMLTLRMFTNRISPAALSRGLARIHLQQFDEVFRLSQSMLPELSAAIGRSFKDVQWRQVARHPSGMMPLLSRLVASIIFAARRSAPSAGQEEAG